MHWTLQTRSSHSASIFLQTSIAFCTMLPRVHYSTQMGQNHRQMMISKRRNNNRIPSYPILFYSTPNVKSHLKVDIWGGGRGSKEDSWETNLISCRVALRVSSWFFRIEFFRVLSGSKFNRNLQNMQAFFLTPLSDILQCHRIWIIWSVGKKMTPTDQMQLLCMHNYQPRAAHNPSQFCL